MNVVTFIRVALYVMVGAIVLLMKILGFGGIIIIIWI